MRLQRRGTTPSRPDAHPCVSLRLSPHKSRYHPLSLQTHTPHHLTPFTAWTSTSGICIDFTIIEKRCRNNVDSTNASSGRVSVHYFSVKNVREKRKTLIWWVVISTTVVYFDDGNHDSSGWNFCSPRHFFLRKMVCEDTACVRSFVLKLSCSSTQRSLPAKVPRNYSALL